MEKPVSFETSKHWCSWSARYWCWSSWWPEGGWARWCRKSCCKSTTSQEPQFSEARPVFRQIPDDPDQKETRRGSWWCADIWKLQLKSMVNFWHLFSFISFLFFSFLFFSFNFTYPNKNYFVKALNNTYHLVCLHFNLLLC